MILTCPQCSTRYHVDPSALGTDSRNVRCASCGHRWSARPPADTPKTVDLDDVPPLVQPQRPLSPPPTGLRPSALTAGLIAAFIALLIASAMIGRNAIVARFPATAAVYEGLGLPAAVDLGLEFADIKSTRLEEGGIAVLVVEGAILNVGDAGRAVPPIRITLLDKSGRELQEELFQAKEPRLEPGTKTSFSGRLVNPADQARNFSVTFEVKP
jgi:predicted Zn finger-like uncharacterized protein